VSDRKHKVWFLSVVKGKGTNQDPRRPLIGDLDHEGDWDAFYNEDETLALVVFRCDSEEKIAKVKRDVSKVKWKKKPHLKERVLKVRQHVEKLANPKIKGETAKKLERIETTGFEELTAEEVEQLGTHFHPRFNRKKLEEPTPMFPRGP